MILESAEWYNFELLTQDPSKTRVGIRHVGERYVQRRRGRGIICQKIRGHRVI